MRLVYSIGINPDSEMISPIGIINEIFYAKINRLTRIVERLFLSTVVFFSGVFLTDSNR